jgi:hypothetical protein
LESPWVKDKIHININDVTNGVAKTTEKKGMKKRFLFLWKDFTDSR